MAAKVIPMPPPASVPMPDVSQVLWPLATVNRAPKPPRQPRRHGIDVGAVITRALTAAGLMK
jgi:feruloyl esterase